MEDLDFSLGLDDLNDVSETGLELEEELEVVEEEEVQAAPRRGRGPDLEMEELIRFNSPEEYKEHAISKEIDEVMTRKKVWITPQAEKRSYVCKFSQKRGYTKCKKQYTVLLPQTCMMVIVEHTHREEHMHEVDPNFTTKTNYHWTPKQEAIIRTGILSNTKNANILENLKDAGATNGSGKYPDLGQLGVKKRYMKTVKIQLQFILDSSGLRVYCKKNSAVPDDENQFFVPYHYIEGDTAETLRLTVIWTTPALMASISEQMIQDDATYKMNWYQYPLFVSGRSSPTGRFFLTHLALSSHEDTAAWVRIHAWVKSLLSRVPRFSMADGAHEITRSLKEVFGLSEEETRRLMCWSHKYRAYSKKLIPIKKLDAEVAAKINNDILKIQWMIQTDKEFRVVFKLLEDKYVERGEYTEDLQAQINSFFRYYRTQWGPDSHVALWYEGAFPFHCSNNQGLEKRNCDIKDNWSYRSQLNMGQFVSVMAKIVEHYSSKDYSRLDGSRMLVLKKDGDGAKEKESFKIQEEGYAYFKEHLKKLPPTVPGGPEVLKPGRQIDINNLAGVTLLSNNPGMEMGQVKRVIGLPSKQSKIKDKSLKELVLLRLQKRNKPEFESLQQYFDIRTSCILVEQIDKEFYCDCQQGMKGKICLEAMALTYSRCPDFQVHKNIDTVQFKRAKRPVGRPKNVGGALRKTPPRALPEPVYERTGYEEIEVQEAVYLEQESVFLEEEQDEVFIEQEQEAVIVAQEQGKRKEPEVCTAQAACEEEDARKAVAKCHICPSLLCESCNTFHTKFSMTRRHSVTYLSTPAESAPAKTAPAEAAPAEAAPAKSASAKPAPTKSGPAKSAPPLEPPAPVPTPPTGLKCRARLGSNSKVWCKPCRSKKRGAVCVGSQAVLPPPPQGEKRARGAENQEEQEVQEAGDISARRTVLASLSPPTKKRARGAK